MSDYRFLFDRDVEKAANLFPAKRVLTLADVGLPENAVDAAIVRKASDRRCTIVTGNGLHLFKEILKYQKLIQRKECRELFGLLVLPNGFEIQKRVIRGLEGRLRDGPKKLSWHAVWNENYYVKVDRSGD